MCPNPIAGNPDLVYPNFLLVPTWPFIYLQERCHNVTVEKTLILNSYGRHTYRSVFKYRSVFNK